METLLKFFPAEVVRLALKRVLEDLHPESVDLSDFLGYLFEAGLDLKMESRFLFDNDFWIEVREGFGFDAGSLSLPDDVESYLESLVTEGVYA